MLQQPTLVFIHSGGGSQGERWLMIGAWSKVYIETALANAKNQNRKPHPGVGSPCTLLQVKESSR